MTSALRSSLLELLEESRPEWASIERATENYQDRLCTIKYKDSTDGGYDMVGWLSDIYLHWGTDGLTRLKVFYWAEIYRSAHFELANPDVIEQVWNQLTTKHQVGIARATL